MSAAILVSQVLLWLAVAGLGLLVTALLRQIGVLHERIAPAGALTLHQHVEVGQLINESEFSTIDGQTIRVGRRHADRSQLIFFISPACPVCKTMIPILRNVADAEASWLDIVLASDGGFRAGHERLIRDSRLQAFPYILSEQLGRKFGVSKLPYAVLIDQTGTIAALGLINNREHFESLFEAKERGVKSIQQYLAHPRQAS